MVWAYLLTGLLILTLISRVQVRVGFTSRGREYLYSLQVLLFWGLLFIEYRGGWKVSQELQVGPLSFQKKREDLLERESIFTYIPYGSLFLETLPLLRIQLVRLSFSLTMNLRDPALTGVGVGLLYALEGVLSPYLKRIASLEETFIEIKPDYYGDISIDFQSIMWTRMGYSMVTLLILLLRILRRRRDHASH